jgi:hypothetical protein
MRIPIGLIFLFTLLSSSLLTLSISSKLVYGDGLFMEQLSASLGDRTADLLIRMSPPVVTTETIQAETQKPTVQFRLFDSSTDENF